jgi:uncharacterized protein
VAAQSTLEGAEHGLTGKGQKSDGHGADEQQARVVQGEAGGDEIAQAATADEGAEGGAGDDFDGGGTDAGDDDGQGKGKLNMAQDLVAGEAHAVGSFDDGRRDVAKTGVGVDEERWSREEDKSEESRAEAEAEVRESEKQDGDARQDAERVNKVQRDEGSHAVARGPDAKREANDGGNQQRQRAQAQMNLDCLDKASAIVENVLQRCCPELHRVTAFSEGQSNCLSNVRARTEMERSRRANLTVVTAAASNYRECRPDAKRSQVSSARWNEEVRVSNLELVAYRRTVFRMYEELRAAGSGDYVAAVERFRQAKDALYAAHPQSPLDAEQRARFTPLRYFMINPALRFVVQLERDDSGATFELPTSVGEAMRGTRIGYVRFALGGVEARLAVYWLTGYGGGLFIPFRDATAGRTSYGGGRYLWDSVKGADLGSDEEEGRIVVDFNMAYNPSCAYNPRWSCPLPPRENWLEAAVEAGEQTYPDDGTA